MPTMLPERTLRSVYSLTRTRWPKIRTALLPTPASLQHSCTSDVHHKYRFKHGYTPPFLSLSPNATTTELDISSIREVLTFLSSLNRETAPSQMADMHMPSTEADIDITSESIQTLGVSARVAYIGQTSFVLVVQKVARKFTRIWSRLDWSFDRQDLPEQYIIHHDIIWGKGQSNSYTRRTQAAARKKYGRPSEKTPSAKNLTTASETADFLFVTPRDIYSWSELFELWGAFYPFSYFSNVAAEIGVPPLGSHSLILGSSELVRTCTMGTLQFGPDLGRVALSLSRSLFPSLSTEDGPSVLTVASLLRRRSWNRKTKSLFYCQNAFFQNREIAYFGQITTLK